MAKFKLLRNGVDSNYVLGGDLNPLSEFSFPMFSMALSQGNAIRVESGGKERKQNCSQW